MQVDKTIFLFDFDGTITRKELLPEIGKMLGENKQREIAHLTQLAIQGVVPYHENLRNRIEVLKEVPCSEIREIVNNIPVYEEVINFLDQNKENCKIITANLDVWVLEFCSKFGLTVHTSHATELNDRIINVNSISLLDKSEVADYYKKLNPNRLVAIGDGHNDAGMMELADISIASGLTHEPSHSLFQVASHIIYSEKTLCRMLRQLL